MEKLYWTKYVFELDEEGFPTGEGKLILIQESDLGFIPDGDAIEVNMNGSKYKTYLKNPDNYELIDFKLFKKEK